MKKIVSAGHEIGNHSHNHTLYTTLSPEEIISDIEKCNAAIKKACGITPYLLRAPSGDYNNTVIEATHRAKMEYIQWSVDTLATLGNGLYIRDFGIQKAADSLIISCFLYIKSKSISPCI